MIGNAWKNSKAPEKRPACDLLGQFARAGTTLHERTYSGRVSRRRHTRHEAPLAGHGIGRQCHLGPATLGGVHRRQLWAALEQQARHLGGRHWQVRF